MAQNALKKGLKILKMKKKPFLQKLTGSNVTLKEWMAMKPYDAPIFNYDAFYVKQAQDVYSYLNEYEEAFQNWGVSKSQMKELSCQIVSYFEDYIVEIGFWRTFIETNKALYGYALPFYDLSEYDETYINVEDIAFLIWHYITKYSPEEYIINPDHDMIMAVSRNILDLFENVMEEAPAIDYYQQFFNIKDNEDYFVFKTKMKWFSTESYLLGVDLGRKLKESQAELAAEIKKSKTNAGYYNIVLYSLLEKYLYQKRSSFSALNAPEWFAKMAKCSDVRRQEIIDLTYWIDGKFFMTHRQEKHFIFEHILTNIEYEVLISSFKNNKDLHPSKTTAYNMHLIRWHGEYLLSGMMYGEEMTDMSIKQYKSSPLETPWILPEKTLKRMREDTAKLYDAFIDFFDSPLMVFDSSAQLDKANADFLDFYRQKIISERDDFTEEDAEKRRKKFNEINQNKEVSSFHESLVQKGMTNDVGLFFIKNVGTYICDDIKETIKGLKAKSLKGQETADLFVSFTNGYTPALCDYLLQEYGSKNLRLPTQRNDIDVVKYLPFYWRMNSPEEFDRSYPLMTMISEDVFE